MSTITPTGGISFTPQELAEANEKRLAENAAFYAKHAWAPGAYEKLAGRMATSATPVSPTAKVAPQQTAVLKSQDIKLDKISSQLTAIQKETKATRKRLDEMAEETTPQQGKLPALADPFATKKAQDRLADVIAHAIVKLSKKKVDKSETLDSIYSDPLTKRRGLAARLLQNPTQQKQASSSTGRNRSWWDNRGFEDRDENGDIIFNPSTVSEYLGYQYYLKKQKKKRAAVKSREIEANPEAFGTNSTIDAINQSKDREARMKRHGLSDGTEEMLGRQLQSQNNVMKTIGQGIGAIFGGLGLKSLAGRVGAGATGLVGSVLRVGALPAAMVLSQSLTPDLIHITPDMRKKFEGYAGWKHGKPNPLDVAGPITKITPEMKKKFDGYAGWKDDRPPKATTHPITKITPEIRKQFEGYAGWKDGKPPKSSSTGPITKITPEIRKQFEGYADWKSGKPNPLTPTGAITKITPEMRKKFDDYAQPKERNLRPEYSKPEGRPTTRERLPLVNNTQKLEQLKKPVEPKIDGKALSTELKKSSSHLRYFGPKAIRIIMEIIDTAVQLSHVQEEIKRTKAVSQDPNALEIVLIPLHQKEGDLTNDIIILKDKLKKLGGVPNALKRVPERISSSSSSTYDDSSPSSSVWNNPNLVKASYSAGGESADILSAPSSNPTMQSSLPSGVSGSDTSAMGGRYMTSPKFRPDGGYNGDNMQRGDGPPRQSSGGGGGSNDVGGYTPPQNPYTAPKNSQELQDITEPHASQKFTTGKAKVSRNLAKNQNELYNALLREGYTDSGARATVAMVSGEALFKPDDVHRDPSRRNPNQKAHGIASWDDNRSQRIYKQFGKYPQDMSVAEQGKALAWETKKYYPKVWATMQDPNISTVDKLAVGVKKFESPADADGQARVRARFLPGMKVQDEAKLEREKTKTASQNTQQKAPTNNSLSTPTTGVDTKPSPEVNNTVKNKAADILKPPEKAITPEPKDKPPVSIPVPLTQPNKPKIPHQLDVSQPDIPQSFRRAVKIARNKERVVDPPLSTQGLESFA